MLESIVPVIVLTTQVVFAGYFAAMTTVYLALDLLALRFLARYRAERRTDTPPTSRLGLDPPISLLVPAYNEERSIATSLASLLRLHYHEYEVIVVNDGSTDRTLDVLTRTFHLVPFPEPTRLQLDTRPLRHIFRSTVHPNLYVIDKDNGGKADALNAGINLAHYPLCCAIDADSVLQPDSLLRIAQPFLENPLTIAAGGTCRPANGCDIRHGVLTRIGLPRNPLALIQIVEYLRAFFFGRLGWSTSNAILIISGAFGLFKKEALLRIGGYRPDTVGEDMDLVVRLHRHYRTERIPYAITFVPDPICWTEAPEDLTTLRHQRIRWQRGLGDSLMDNLGLLCHRRGGTVGWIAFPFFLFFEWFGPFIELFGYLVLFLGALSGVISWHAWFAFTGFALACGMLLSTSAVFLEEWSFRSYQRVSHLLLLIIAAMAENLGYRQLMTWWRFVGICHWIRGGKAQWGAMRRRTTWSEREASESRHSTAA